MPFIELDMNKFILSLALVAIFAAIFSQAANPAPCPYKFVGGSTYDFGHIGTLTGTFNEKPVYLNFCENVSKTLCPDGDSNICAAKTGSGDDVSFATRNSGSLPPNLTYEAATKTNIIKEHSGKAQCYSFGYLPRQLSIHLTCGDANSKTFEITDLRQSCQFETTLTVKCDNGGSSSGLSGGAIFLIIFFSVLAGYFVLGFLVCKFALKKEGVVQAIPQHQFWCALPGLYIAGIKFVIGKITGKGKSAASATGEAQYYGATEEV